jgi:glycosyltransferase involved in cell wall biosynthesis
MDGAEGSLCPPGELVGQAMQEQSKSLIGSCGRQGVNSGGLGRVLVLAPQPFYEDRGTPIAVSYVLRALSDLGYEVDILTLPIGRHVDICRVCILRLSNPLKIRTVPVGLSWRKLFFDALLVLALHRQLRAKHYTCIHAVEEAAFPAIFFGRRKGIPVVYDMQSSLPEQLDRRWFCRIPWVRSFLRGSERWLLANASAVISSSGLAASTRAAVPTARITEWYFPSLTQAVAADEISRLREQLAIPKACEVVLYSGTFADYQGLDLLLEAIPLVLAAMPRVVFVMVGGTRSESEALRRQIADAGIIDQSRVVERQPREVIPAFLAMADVLVSTRSYGGNLPLKIFDYLATGRPIVATDIPCHRAILNDDCAFLIESNAAGVARGILEALNNRARTEVMVANAQQYAERYFGLDEFRNRLQKVYDLVINPRPQAVSDQAP